MTTPSTMPSWPTIIVPISWRSRRRSEVNSATVASISRGGAVTWVMDSLFGSRRRSRRLVDLDVEARLRVDLREVALDVVLVARGQLLVAHDLLDDRLVLLIDVLVAARREALLRGGEDRLAARG